LGQDGIGIRYLFFSEFVRCPKATDVIYACRFTSSVILGSPRLTDPKWEAIGWM
jgi:hypothetical protein